MTEQFLHFRLQSAKYLNCNGWECEMSFTLWNTHIHTFGIEKQDTHKDFVCFRMTHIFDKKKKKNYTQPKLDITQSLWPWVVSHYYYIITQTHTSVWCRIHPDLLRQGFNELTAVWHTVSNKSFLQKHIAAMPDKEKWLVVTWKSLLL